MGGELSVNRVRYSAQVGPPVSVRNRKRSGRSLRHDRLEKCLLVRQVVIDGHCLDAEFRTDAAHSTVHSAMLTLRRRLDELEGEIDAGFWYVADADPSLFFRRDIGTLWNELVTRLGNGHAPSRGPGFWSVRLRGP